MEVLLHFGEDRSTETSHCIPAFRGNISSIATTRFSAIIIASGDVSEGRLVSSVHLVQQGVGKTNRALAVVEQVAIEQRDDSSEHGSRRRSSVGTIIKLIKIEICETYSKKRTRQQT